MANIPEETIRQVAWIAWKGAANAYIMYPDNNHTFSNYWDGAKTQFDEFKKELEEKEALLKEYRQAVQTLYNESTALEMDKKEMNRPYIIYVQSLLNK